MLSVMCWSLLLSLGINIALFLVAFRFKSDKLTDASYALSFIALALFAFQQTHHTLYSAIGTNLVCVWAVRIGSFLLYRVLRTGKDRRFDDMRDDFWKFGKFWLGQALTVWVLMIPIILALHQSHPWRMTSLIGVGIWLIGFAIESIADLQKYRFTHNPAHKDQWIDSGIWHYSRHPNYFGEILVWVGIYVFAAQVLSVTDQFIGLVSPLFITVLLLFVSGVPILEKSADKKWGNVAGYREYKQRTSLLIPLPKKSE